MRYCITIITFLFSIASAYPQYARVQVDSIGFAVYGWQMDALIKKLPEIKSNSSDTLRFAVCPHDDYTYAGEMYNEIFSRVKANTIIILGVAHKAKKFGIERKIVFDSYTHWKGPYGNVKISGIRKDLTDLLPDEDFIISDSLQAAEHSVEAFVPFIQYYNRNAEIISILVPAMPPGDMYKISDDICNALHTVMREKKLKWGKDIMILVSNDAVHYGDEDWGGKNYAPFGSDSTGYKKATDHEKEIIAECFTKPTPAGAEILSGYTVQEDDWHEYKWTWCGRYSVPFALITAFKLQLLDGNKPFETVFKKYSTSIDHSPIKVDDIKMGATAPANLHHWVGYFAVGYK